MVFRSCAVLAPLMIVDGLILGDYPKLHHRGNNSPANSSSFDEFLWDGNDDVEVESRARDMAKNPPKLYKTYVLLGPEDGGTNLLQFLIQNNFKDIYCSHRPGGPVWKHSNDGAQNIYKAVEKNLWYQNLSETPVVMVIRSPLSQITSWKEHPYDMLSCVNRPYKRMNIRCYPTLATTIPYQGGGGGRVGFGNTIDVYNKYLKQYQQILADKKFKDAHLFTYEDLVYSPEDVIHVLAKVLGYPVPAVIHLQDRPLKRGMGNGREQAMEKIEKRLYLEDITQYEQQIMCSGLDTINAGTMIEGSYLSKADPKRKSHSYDCQLAAKGSKSK